MNNVTLTQPPTLVKYHPSARAWQVLNGQCTSFPAGPAGRRQAHLCALEHDRPDIAATLQAMLENIAVASLQMPLNTKAIESRLLKAAFLLRDGKLLPPRAWDTEDSYLCEIARVKSQSKESWPDGSPVEYAVCQDTPDSHLWCACEDYSEGAPVLPSGQIACKHILSVLIAGTLEEDGDLLAEIDF
jgi:hypothetical protein